MCAILGGTRPPSDVGRFVALRYLGAGRLSGLKMIGLRVAVEGFALLDCQGALLLCPVHLDRFDDAILHGPNGPVKPQNKESFAEDKLL